MKPKVILDLEEVKVLVEFLEENHRNTLKENKDIKEIVDKMDEQYKLGKGQVIRKKGWHYCQSMLYLSRNKIKRGRFNWYNTISMNYKKKSKTGQ